ncbi:MAG: hypothetical protein KBC73_18615 [Burkholderiaceae bacterium]|nr:hypothetical protein [Burkholderiaceae bacterium]
MRITEDLLLPAATGPWGQIAKRAAQAFMRTTGRPFQSLWLEEAALFNRKQAMPDDVVGWGFARKAVGQMRSTCPMCGELARRRARHGRVTYRCAACQLPAAFAHELEKVMHHNLEPSGSVRTLWPEHQVPELVRHAVPTHAWRRLDLKDGATLRFLTGDDVEALVPWLSKLGERLVADSNARMARVAERESSAPADAREESNEHKGGDA